MIKTFHWLGSEERAFLFYLILTESWNTPVSPPHWEKGGQSSRRRWRGLDSLSKIRSALSSSHHCRAGWPVTTDCTATIVVAQLLQFPGDFSNMKYFLKQPARMWRKPGYVDISNRVKTQTSGLSTRCASVQFYRKKILRKIEARLTEQAEQTSYFSEYLEFSQI